VVPTIDISDTQDAGYYLVMDYIEGDHLGALLQKAYKLGTRLPAPIALRIIVDTLDGLAAAHALTDENGRLINLVHRDISPHNIMVSTDGIARITDFGVAKAEVRLSTTRQGQFKGKLAYMAPEHASVGDADQRSDLFSVAIILWECLTGRRLFRAENQAATLNKICIEPIPMPSSVDPALAPFDPVLERGLARDPAQRYQTAAEFAEAIEERAELLGGLANPRTVAKVVREYAAEKIERDSELIRSAISEISAAGGSEGGLVAPPMPGDAHVPGTSGAVPAYPAAPMPPPIELPESLLEQKPQRRWSLWLLGALVLVAAGLALSALFMKNEPQRVTTTPLNQPAAAEPQPTEPEPKPPDTTATAPSGETAATNGTATNGAATNGATNEATPAPATTPPAVAKPVEPPKPSEPVQRGEPRTRQRRDSAEHRRPVAASPERAPAPEKPAKPKEPDILLNPYRSQ
jgi:serine/threonine-protein kinase